MPRSRRRPSHVQRRPIASPAFRALLSRVREAPGDRSDTTGRWIPGAATTVLIRCATAPADTDSETAREVLPEGTRTTQSRLFWCGRGDLRVGDVVRWPAVADQVFDVVTVADWNGITVAVGVWRDA